MDQTLYQVHSVNKNRADKSIPVALVIGHLAYQWRFKLYISQCYEILTFD